MIDDVDLISFVTTVFDVSGRLLTILLPIFETRRRRRRVVVVDFVVVVVVVAAAVPVFERKA